MIDELTKIYRRIDETLQRRPIRLTCAAIAFILGLALFVPILVKSYSLDSQREALTQVLERENFNSGDPNITSLATTGYLTVNGRKYGDPIFQNPPVPYIDADGTIIDVNFVINLLLRDQQPGWAPTWLIEHPNTTLLLSLAAIIWLQLVIWLDLLLPFVLTVTTTGFAVLLAAIVGTSQLMLAVGGIGMLIFTFVLLTRVALVLLNPRFSILAVAHTVVKEGSRTRLSLIFVVILLVVLPLIPLKLDPEAPLRFRMQTFISYSMGASFYFAAFLTMFLATSTVAFEIRDRQIWQLMTKPLNQFQYLLGKWLGVMAVNVIILVVSSVSIFGFIQYLRGLPTGSGEEGAYDRLAVDEQILTARKGVFPQWDSLTPEQLRERVDQFILNDPDMSQAEEISIAARQSIMLDMQQQYLRSQRSVPPVNERGEISPRSYVFRGLGPAKQFGEQLVLRYQFHILRDDTHAAFPATFVFNDDQNLMTQRTFVPTMTHTISLSPTLIRDDGTIKLTIVNEYVPKPDEIGFGQINFELDGLEILYKVGNFEGNFLRAILANWLKLGFLAALAISFATFLSFPVAILASFTIFLGGSLAPFLGVALDEYNIPDASTVDWSDIGYAIYWLFEKTIQSIARSVVWSLRAFGDFRPTGQLVEGRMIEWSLLGVGLVKLVLLWAGGALVLGYAVMRNRQLAIYSGHG